MFKKVLISLFFSLTLLCFSAKAGFFEQTTNSFYKQGEMNIEIAPTMTSQTPFSFKPDSKRVYGYSIETEYWQTKNTGTGLELGCYDAEQAGQIGGLDHIAVMEDIRIISFDKTSFLNRFALELKLGTGTYLLNGSKYIQFGPGIDFQITKDIRAQLFYTQNYVSNPTQDSGTFRFGFQYIF